MDIAILEKRLREIKELLINGQDIPNGFFESTNDEYLCSAQNLLHYLQLRNIDIREIQSALTGLGISSLGTGAGYVLENVSRSLELVRLIQGWPFELVQERSALGHRESDALLEARSESLFDLPKRQTRTKIMVTMPDETAYDTVLLKGLFSAGTDVTRINLSHGNPDLWDRMLDNISNASEELNLKTCVFMDLPGPKIRVGRIHRALEHGNGYREVDTISLRRDCQFVMMKESEFGKLKSTDKTEGHIVTVLLPEIIDDLEVGHRIFFDDGAIEGQVVSRSSIGMLVKISNTTRKRLRPGKGINLPDTHLSLPSLTAKDLELLPYACENADIIGYSFVRTPEDVALLYTKLSDIGDTDTGVVFKIENKEAFDNLPRILFEAMKRPRIGVMIARGDLAVEMGFDRISEVKNQIMAICEAAHIPVIWATQVLESMAKKGLASRAEISDVVLSVQAECVMLNKGPYITDTVAILKNILLRMEEHSKKNKKTLRALGVAKNNLKSIRSANVL